MANLLFTEALEPRLLFHAPDLVVSAVECPTGTFAPGDAYSYQVTVANNGPDRPAGEYFVEARLSIDQTFGNADDVFLEDFPAGALDAQTSETFSRLVSIPDAPSGVYHLMVQADSRNQVEEADEDNNIGICPDTLTLNNPSQPVQPTPTPPPPPSPILFPGDFNGDGVDDLLALDPNTGAVDAWIISNGVRVAVVRMGVVDPFNATISGIGDFNGDGTDDVLWSLPEQNTVGEWLVRNGTSIGWLTLGNADFNFVQALGAGNFNGDAYDDVLWLDERNGQVFTWIINNGFFAGATGVGVVDLRDWEVSNRIGDFNGDGTDDVLLLNRSLNVVGTWLVSNGTATDFSTFGANDLLNNRVLHVGDFNGDGTTDLLWGDFNTGRIYTWLISGGTISAVTELGAMSFYQFAPRAAGDFNGDGTTDIAWENLADRSLFTWIVRDGQVVGSTVIAPVI